MLHRFVEKGAWFRAKKYGYGAGLPLVWQGWTLIPSYLDLYSITFAHHDGVDFVLWQGARRARCNSIVTDKQRRQRAKAARLCGVVFRKPLSLVVCLRVAPLRDCTALLVSGFLKTIMVCKCDRIKV